MAIRWAADHGANVISMSLQSSTFNTNLQNALAYAYDLGVLPIGAAGNNGTTPVSYPGAYSKCMSIGATDNLDVRASFSNFGTELDVVAPGVNVYSCWNDGAWRYESGTSMATPHVAGLAGLIHSRNPALNSAQIESIIKTTADDKGAAGWDQFYGWGRINLNAALFAAAPPCPADVNHSHAVNVDDLLAVITAWGACPIPPALCPADVAPIGPPQGNGVVNVDDLLLVITHWGACP